MCVFRGMVGGKRKKRLWVGRREGKKDKIKFSVPLVLID